MVSTPLGAHYLGDGRCSFRVWAPHADTVELKILSPRPDKIPMMHVGKGYWEVESHDVEAGTRYLYVLNQKLVRPDPASHFQPEGVHNASQVIDHTSFRWNDAAWRGLDIAEYVIYELHVGTFSPEGNFKGVIQKLDELKELGITAIELMPVSQFPGTRNWGYDGVYPFAVQNSYGTPDDLKHLVDECHRREMAVIMDVVYNHLGPEGNYLRDFGPYFTSKYKTPWGEAINFDDEFSDEVKHYFISNAIYWFDAFHIDALRLDAIHAIYDMSAKHFLHSLADKTKEYSRQRKRKFYLIAESDLNDARIIKPAELGGYGIDAQWCDDFHHSVHTLLTGEDSGYYRDYGGLEHLAKALKDGFVYRGQYSEYRKRSHGNSSAERPADQFVVCIQNHDQVGNRMAGERLSQLVPFDKLKLGAGLMLLSPYVPLIFMGEEYGEDNPFLYFVSHSDPELIEAVRKGRREEFREFHATGQAPDPHDEKTFERSKLDHSKKTKGVHNTLYRFYQNLLTLRRQNPVLSNLSKSSLEVFAFENDGVLVVKRWKDNQELLIIYNVRSESVTLRMLAYRNTWRVLVHSHDREWGGKGALVNELIHPEDDVTVEGFGFIVLGSEQT